MPIVPGKYRTNMCISPFPPVGGSAKLGMPIEFRRWHIPHSGCSLLESEVEGGQL